MASPEIEIPQLTKEQQLAVTAQYLRGLRAEIGETGLIPYPVFHAMAGLMVLSTVEVAMVRRQPSHDPEILLTQRPPEDEDWANQWHIPGSAIRGTDRVEHENDYGQAINRAIREAGGTIEMIAEPRRYDVVRRKGSRGSEITPRFMAIVTGEPERGQFYDINNVLREPPEGGLLGSHAEAIEAVAQHYAAFQDQERIKFEGF